jgi:hypothetical protein
MPLSLAIANLDARQASKHLSCIQYTLCRRHALIVDPQLTVQTHEMQVQRLIHGHPAELELHCTGHIRGIFNTDGRSSPPCWAIGSLQTAEPPRRTELPEANICKTAIFFGNGTCAHHAGSRESDASSMLRSALTHSPLRSSGASEAQIFGFG